MDAISDSSNARQATTAHPFKVRKMGHVGGYADALNVKCVKLIINIK